MLMYLGGVMPFVETKQNALAIADESILLLLASLMLFFDQGGNAPSERSTLLGESAVKNYKVGYLGVFLIAVHILIHICFQVFYII